MYADGLGVTQDYVEAVTWLRRAAEKRLAAAQYNLGNMYLLGHGVPQDYVQAHMWLNLAAIQSGLSDNSNNGDRAVAKNAAEQLDKVGASMTPAQIAEAQRSAREWRPNPTLRIVVHPRKGSRP
jgi:TPR repeat protein